MTPQREIRHNDIECPHCGATISATAQACPRCHGPIGAIDPAEAERALRFGMREGGLFGAIFGHMHWGTVVTLGILLGLLVGCGFACNSLLHSSLQLLR